LTDVSEQLTASIALMMEAVSSSETWSISTKQHGATYQTTAIFILVVVVKT
jgi:hypothetical protein